MSGLTHAMRLMAEGVLRLALSGTSTESSSPSRLNAWPDWPAAKLAPACMTPSFPPTASLASPSPLHQPIKPSSCNLTPFPANWVMAKPRTVLPPPGITKPSAAAPALVPTRAMTGVPAYPG